MRTALLIPVTVPLPGAEKMTRLYIVGCEPVVEKKEDMKKRGIRSPDGADALALTFAEPVVARDPHAIASQNSYKAATSAGY